MIMKITNSYEISKFRNGKIKKKPKEKIKLPNSALNLMPKRKINENTTPNKMSDNINMKLNVGIDNEGLIHGTASLSAKREKRTNNKCPNTKHNEVKLKKTSKAENTSADTQTSNILGREIAKSDGKPVKKKNENRPTKLINADGQLAGKLVIEKQKENGKLKHIKFEEIRNQENSATVFVGNLPVKTKRKQLASLFEPYSSVKAIRLRTAAGHIMFKHSLRKNASSLNAYVVLRDKMAANNALALNGTEFMGNHLRVTLADNIFNSNMDLTDKSTVFVGNLKHSASEESIRDIFSNCGEINYVRCLYDKNEKIGKSCKGVAFVCFKSRDAVGLALELNGTILDDRPIRVERYNIKKIRLKEKQENSKLHLKRGLQNKTKLSQKKSTFGKGKKQLYKGIQADVTKHKVKRKRKMKKGNNEMLKLAKKIAPIAPIKIIK